MPPSANQLQQLASTLTSAFSERNVTEAQAASVRSCFPNAVHLSLTSALAKGTSVDLYEHYNMVQPGPLKTNVYPGTTPSAAAEAIAANQNIFYDEAIHKQKAMMQQDFVQLSTHMDCSAIVCVPLPCHSKMSSAQQLAADPRAVCRHCNKPVVMAGQPLGCLTLGLQRRTNFSIREVLAKMVVLAGCLGNKLASAPARAASSSARVLNTAPTPASQAMLNLALNSSFYNATPTSNLPLRRSPNSPMHSSASNRRGSLDLTPPQTAGSLGGSWSGPSQPLSRIRGPSMPTLGEGPPFGQMGPDPYIADYQRRASADTWMMSTNSAYSRDTRMSLDSQTSAASHMLMGGSRGSSMDAGCRSYPPAPLVSLPESLSTVQLPNPGPITDGMMRNPFSQGSLPTAAASGLTSEYMSLSGPPLNLPLFQGSGLMDLVNASPDKLELLQALYQLQLEQQAAEQLCHSSEFC